MLDTTIEEEELAHILSYQNVVSGQKMEKLLSLNEAHLKMVTYMQP
jgi:hypothetical protein